MQKNNLSISTFRNFITVCGIVATIAFYGLRLEGLTGSYFSTAVSILGLFIVLFSLKSLLTTLGNGPLYSGFRFIFLGILCSELGMILWAWFMLSGSLKLANQVPTFLFFATYILNFIGFLKLAITIKVDVQKFWGMIVSFSILGIILTTIANAAHSNGSNIINTAFVMGDFLRLVVISLTLQMVVIYQGGLLSRYWLSIFIGNLFIIIGNFSSAVLFKEYSAAIWPYTLIDLIFVGGYLFVAHGYYGIGDSVRLAQKKITEYSKKK